MPAKAATPKKFPKCTSCKEQHDLPRGKKCAFYLAKLGLSPEKKKDEKNDNSSKMDLAFQQRLTKFMDNVEGRLTAIERRRSSSLPSHDSSPGSSRGRKSRSKSRHRRSRSTRSRSRRRSKSASPGKRKYRREPTPEDAKDRSLPKPNSASMQRNKFLSLVLIFQKIGPFHTPLPLPLVK